MSRKEHTALFRTLLPPTGDLQGFLSSRNSFLFDGGGLLAPDVNFFLNSRKQGLHCWHSLLFSFLSPNLSPLVSPPYKEDPGYAAAFAIHPSQMHVS